MSQSTEGLPFWDTVVFYVLETIAFASGFEAVVSHHAGESSTIYLGLLARCVACAILGFATKDGWLKKTVALSRLRWMFYAVALGIPTTVGWLFPNHDVRIGVQLLPCCRGPKDPEIKRASGAALTIQNLSKESVHHNVSAELKFPNIGNVKLDNPERIKLIGGGRGSYVHLLAPELAPEEISHATLEFAGMAEFTSIVDWRRAYGYAPNIVLIGPGAVVIGPTMVNPLGPAAPASCRSCHA